MGSAYLSSYISNSIGRADALLPEVAATPTFDNSYLTCGYFRTLGACSYLRDLDTATLFDSLHRSAGCYLHALKELPESEKRISECEPVFDAICAGLNGAVTEMIPFVPDRYNADYEYEDDFLYVYFLLNYFYESEKNLERCEKILSDFENSLSGFSARFDICKAFFDKEENDFTDAFDQFLLEREQTIIGKIEREAMAEEEWAWRKYISFEGMALLQLASESGFNTDINYSQIPEELRKPPATTFNKDRWKSSLGEPYWV